MAPEPGGERLGEFERIARFVRPLAEGYPNAFQLTDDAALLEVPPGFQGVVTTDALVAGVHFFEGDAPADIAAKMLRVNLSDLAAMGADPVAYTLVTALPPSCGEDWLAAFAAGLAEDQARYGVTLIGGDSVATPGPPTLMVTAFGRVPQGQALRRRVAAPPETWGDQAVFVTGTIGDAALGLQVLLGTLDVPESLAAPLVARLRRPEPRLGLGAHLRGIASAAIDISDGLVADLGHIAEVSACAFALFAADIPLSPSARTVLAERPALWATVLTGGDDYELAFTAPRAARGDLEVLAARHGVAITEIGRFHLGHTSPGTMTPGTPGTPGAIISGAITPGAVTVESAAGIPLVLPRRGWNHFVDSV